MSPVVGLMLPFAVGVALSPVPIAAVILMVLSLHPGIGGRVFVVGWAVGLLLAVAVMTFLIGLLGLGSAGRVELVRLVLGVALVLFAWERASAGRGSAYDTESPPWVAGLDRLPADRAFAMGALQAGLDPRKLVMIAAVGLLFAGAQLTMFEAAVAAILFAIVGSLGVAAPLAMSRGSSAGRARLDAARARLMEDNTTIQAVTLLLLGALLLGQGLAGL